jgi:hypothetical protein
VSDASIIEFVRRFLESVCAGSDAHVDHKIEAGELLRKHEAPRVMSEIVRPIYREDEKKIDPEEERRQRAEVMARRREHIERTGLQIGADLIAAGREQSLIASGVSLEEIEKFRKALRERGTE